MCVHVHFVLSVDFVRYAIDPEPMDGHHTDSGSDSMHIGPPPTLPNMPFGVAADSLTKGESRPETAFAAVHCTKVQFRFRSSELQKTLGEHLVHIRCRANRHKTVLRPRAFPYRFNVKGW